MDELKEQITSHFDELQLLDFLDIDMEQLVELLEDHIKENRERFERAIY